MIEKAYSDLPAAASWTPTTFSIALPAIATMTKPANACEMSSDSIAGSSASTNQSEPNADSAPAAASSPIASTTGHLGASASDSAAARSPSAGDSLRNENGN